MEIIDIVIFGLLLFGGIRGFRNGIINQAVSVVALLLGIWVAIRFSDLVSKLLIEKFNFNTEYTSIVAFIITFAAAVVGVHFVGKVAEKLVDAVALGFVNKLAGFAVGLLLWGFIISVVLSIGNNFNLPDEQTKEKSIIYNPVSKIAPAVFPYLKFDAFKDKFKKLTNPDSDNSQNV